MLVDTTIQEGTIQRRAPHHEQHNEDHAHSGGTREA